MIRQQLAQHRLALSLVLARMRRTKMALLLMVAVIGVTLSLPAMLYVALDNLQRLAGGLQTAPQVSLFLALGTTPQQVKEIDDKLSQHSGVASHRFVSRDSAWQTMQQDSGLGEVAGGLEHNPLPDAYIVEAKEGDPAAVERMQQEMQQWPGVEHAQLDAAWLKRLYGLVELGNKLVLVIAGLLGCALLIITGNSIRLQIATQREEIELSRLIGATDRFIRRPFLYAGTLYGVGGGLAAWLVLAGAVWLFNASVADLARLYASDFRLLMPSTDALVTLVGGSALLGWIGSYVAVNRALADIESY